MVLYLDNQNRLLEHETMFLGSVNSTEVHPREIVKSVLRHNAVAVILAHNHPSGITDASKADRTITDRIVNALNLVEVRVLDHFIIGDGDTLSLLRWAGCNVEPTHLSALNRNLLWKNTITLNGASARGNASL